jgi:hypothetical protein
MSWNRVPVSPAMVRMRPQLRRRLSGSIGVPIRLGKTSPFSCQSGQVSVRSVNCCRRCSRRASKHRGGSGIVRAESSVLVVLLSSGPCGRWWTSGGRPRPGGYASGFGDQRCYAASGPARLPAAQALLGVACGTVTGHPVAYRPGIARSFPSGDVTPLRGYRYQECDPGTNSTRITLWSNLAVRRGHVARWWASLAW